MHGGDSAIRDVLFGTDGEQLYVRVNTDVTGKFGIEFETGPAKTLVVVGRIVEMSARLAGRRFRVTIDRDGWPAETVPAQGWIELSGVE